jgi:acyl-CoA thioesterase-2
LNPLDNFGGKLGMMPGAAELLALQPLTGVRFRGLHNMDGGAGAIFGGQPLLQGLEAARRTVADWPAHSLSANFLRAGPVDQPVEYTVDKVRDGRRFAARRVLATQGTKPIVDMLCSFHDPEQGPAHQHHNRTAGAPPAESNSLQLFAQANAHRLRPERLHIYRRPFPVELRLIDPEAALFGQAACPERIYWLRMESAAAIESGLQHQCLVALMSDYWLASTPFATHAKAGNSGRGSAVTLNHSLWFHAPVRADSWLLYQTASPWAGEGRGLVRGLIHDESGQLVASAVQEISMRGFGDA